MPYITATETKSISMVRKFAHQLASKCFLAFGFLALTFTTSQAQELKRESLFSKYNRSGLTYLYLENNEPNFGSRAMNQYRGFKVPEKFDDNSIRNNVLSRPANFRRGLRKEDSVLYFRLLEKEVFQQLTNQLFNADKEGRYNYQGLLKRARYNIGDEAVRRLEFSSRGIESNLLSDNWISPLLKNTYLILFDVYNITDYDEYYQREDNRRAENARRSRTASRPVDRLYRGYYARANIVAYRVDFSDTSLTTFFENYWADSSSKPEVLKQKLAQRKEMKLKVRRVAARDFEIQSRVNRKSPLAYKSQTELFEELFQGLPLNAQELLEDRVAETRVRQVIFNTRPLEAKVGKKEGVFTDQKFDVFEKEITADGSEITHYVGSIRAGGIVTDNRSVSIGETVPTKFYQVQGKRLDAGMVMEQVPEAGFSGTAGVMYNGYLNGYIRVDFWLGRYANSSSEFLSAFKVYADASYTYKTFDDPVRRLNYTEVSPSQGTSVAKKEAFTAVDLFSIGFGAGKGFYFWRNFLFEPYAGFRVYSASFNDAGLNTRLRNSGLGETYNFAWLLPEAGARLALQVGGGFRVMADAGLNPATFNSESSFFGERISSRLSPNDRALIGLNDAGVAAAYGISGSSNPFYIPFAPYRLTLGINFEF